MTKQQSANTQKSSIEALELALWRINFKNITGQKLTTRELNFARNITKALKRLRRNPICSN